MLFIVGMLIVSACGDAMAQETEQYRFERMWPALHQSWAFQPYDVAIGPSGAVYVVDALNCQIHKYSSDGHLITIWGARGSAEGEFDLWPLPNLGSGAVAIDAEENVYVVDTRNQRVQKFTASGQFLLSWGSAGTGDGRFSDPWGIAVDAGGMVYVSDYTNGTVQKFRSDGTHLLTATGFDAPAGIACDAGGELLVIERGASQVVRLDETLIEQDRWGVQGVGAGQLDSPIGIAINAEGNVYVSESSYVVDRVQVFTAGGEFLFGWGQYGARDGQMYDVKGLAIGGNGILYLCDALNYRIQKFSLTGTFITSWSAIGDVPGRFNRPADVAADAAGNYYVVDEYNHRIQKFDDTGQFLLAWGEKGGLTRQFRYPMAVAVDGDDVYVADNGNNRIQKFNAQGNYLGQWDCTADIFGLAVDADHHVFVADRAGNRILKFDTSGNLLASWGTYGTGEGAFDQPWAVAVDGAGAVYVGDYRNRRIQKFDNAGSYITSWSVGDAMDMGPTSLATDAGGNAYVGREDGVFLKYTGTGLLVAVWGEMGSAPGNSNLPLGVTVGGDGRVAVADAWNHRVQVFRAVGGLPTRKAIIVAGGGAYEGNSLWDATQLNANYAYRTLAYNGFNKSRIQYLSSDTDLDLDGNGVFDDIDARATAAGLEQAITGWALDADEVVLYLVDHGGDGTFRMSGTETLTASAVDGWLDILQETMPGRVTVVYDACESGSFLPELVPPEGKERIVVSSTAPRESAYFISQGAISFSYFFWSQIFNGSTVGEAFDLSAQAMDKATGQQHPMIDDNGDGVGNGDGDGLLAGTSAIGEASGTNGDAPVIGTVSPDQTITEGNTASLYAEGVNDADGIARVWAVIKPPDYAPDSAGSPVQGFPRIDLLPVGGDRYEAAFDDFSIEGTYYVAVYASDRLGNTAAPILTTVSVNHPLRHKAMIVVGAAYEGAVGTVLADTAAQAYRTLAFQGYAETDIHVFSDGPVGGFTVDGPATRDALTSALTGWAQTQTRDMVIYLVGDGGFNHFRLNDGESIDAQTLDSLLDGLEAVIPGWVTVICDAPEAGSLLPGLAASPERQRVVMASTAAGSTAHFVAAGAVSFSRFFWAKVLDGSMLHDAFLHAKKATQYVFDDQVALCDSNGNGVGNEKTDRAAALLITLGTGIMLAGDDPLVGAVSPAQTISGATTATVWAADVTTTGTIDRVWAVVTPPPPSATAPVVVDMPINTASGRYEGQMQDLTLHGTYGVGVYAMDTRGAVSLPVTTTVTQITGPDAFEVDDTPVQAGAIAVNNPAAQQRTLHVVTDEDWVRFFGVAGTHYAIAAEHTGARIDAVIRVFDADGVLLEELDDTYEGEDENLPWQCPADGVYFIQISQAQGGVYGPDNDYDLKIYTPTGRLPGLFYGLVTDQYGHPVSGATVRTVGYGFAALSQVDGAFLLYLPAGTYTITGTLPGGQPVDHGEITIEGDRLSPFPVTLDRVYAGDLNSDGEIDLADAVLAVKTLAAMETQGEIRSDYLSSGADVNGDGRVGWTEVLWTLQHAAGVGN